MMSTKSFKPDDLHKALILCEAAAFDDYLAAPSGANSSNNNTSGRVCHCRQCQALPPQAQGTAMPEVCNHRFHIWHTTPHYRSYYASTRRKLFCLILVASLALLSIVLISEQLISRHFHRSTQPQGLQAEILLSPMSGQVIEELDILTLEDWIDHESTDFPLKLTGERHLAGEEVVTDDPINTFPTQLIHVDGTVLIEDGIFWSSAIEAKVAPGPSDQEVQSQIQQLRQRQVIGVDKPDWLHCGREKNRFVHFDDGSQACARFRSFHNEFVQGEVMAFYLARLLGITNTPAVTLSKIDSNQWNILQASPNSTDWPKDAIVALIEWLPNLTKTTMPVSLRNIISSESSSQPLDVTSVKELSVLDENVLTQLVQWSDLILFDYLTGNYDRVASMQDGADKEKRPAILRETIHNLALSAATGSLWMIDNESAFLDAYSLLYSGDDNGNRFIGFHETLLRSMCIFRKKTINRLFALHKSQDPASLLLKFVADNEPLFSELPKIYPNSIFTRHFPERLEQAWQWVKQCQLQV